MALARLLILVGLIGFAWHWWGERRTAVETAEATSPTGFVSAAMPAEATPNTVLILAPLNCPSDGAQRADRLADELTSRNIPVRRASRFSLQAEGGDEDLRARVDRSVAVLNGEIPAVFVNGMAKSNPSVEDVVAEFRRTR